MVYGARWGRRPPKFSELEIDEGLQVGCDELVEAEYACHHYKEHQPEGHLGKPEAVAAFETLGEL